MYVHVYVCAFMCVCACVRPHVCVHVCMCVCMLVCVTVCSVNTYVCIYMYIRPVRTYTCVAMPVNHAYNHLNMQQTLHLPIIKHMFTRYTFACVNVFTWGMQTDGNKPLLLSALEDGRNACPPSQSCCPQQPRVYPGTKSTVEGSRRSLLRRSLSFRKCVCVEGGGRTSSGERGCRTPLICLNPVNTTLNERERFTAHRRKRHRHFHWIQSTYILYMYIICISTHTHTYIIKECLNMV